jgi:type IV secretion system protein VirD4
MKKAHGFDKLILLIEQKWQPFKAKHFPLSQQQWLILAGFGVIVASSLAGLLFCAWETIPLRYARPWTVFHYGIYYLGAGRWDVVLASFNWLLLSSWLVSLPFLAYWPGKGLKQRKRLARLSAFILIGGFLLLWLLSLIANLLYPTRTLPLPWHFIKLWTHFSKLHVGQQVTLIATSLLPVAIAGIMAYRWVQDQQIKRLFGDAHWATHREIYSMGLFDEDNDLIIGLKGRRILKAKLSSHALVFAPSRSGKGVAQVIPNAFSFKGSLLAIDMKQEIFAATSGYREKVLEQDVYLFAPGSSEHKTHCWNPLDAVSRDRVDCIADLQLVVNSLVVSESGKTDMWINEARSLALGLLLWLMESGRDFTLGTLTNFVKGEQLEEELESILQQSINADESVTIHPAAFTNLNNFIQKADKERSGVKSTLTACLNLWDDPFIQAATHHSDFDVRDMRRKKMTIYLGVPTHQLDRLAPLLNLFVQQFISLLTVNLPTQNEPYKVLALLDEFCALGRMDKLQTAFGFLAGYNVHLMTVIQNIGQFYSLYGGRDNCDIFLQNTDYKISYRQNTPTDQQFISQQLGNRALKNRTQGFNEKAFGRVPGRHIHEAYISRPLLTPDEVRLFPAKQGIALISGQPPVKYTKLVYHEHEDFKNYVLDPVEIPKLEVQPPVLKAKKPKIASGETEEERQLVVDAEKMKEQSTQEKSKRKEVVKNIVKKPKEQKAEMELD